MAGILSQMNVGPMSFDPGVFGAAPPAFDPNTYTDPRILAGILAASKAKAGAIPSTAASRASSSAAGDIAAAAAPPPVSPLAATRPSPPLDLSGELRARAAGFLGDPTTTAARVGALQQARDSAAQMKMDAINRAADSIRAAITGNVNIPLLMAAGALGQPTRTGRFGEELSNAMSAGAKSLMEQRNMALQGAEAAGRMQQEGAGVPLDLANANSEDFYKNSQLGSTMLQSAGLDAYRAQTGDYRDQMVGYHNRMADAADARANAELAKATPSDIRSAQDLVKQGVATDLKTAYMMVKGGYKQNPTAYSNAISNRMHQIQMNDMTGQTTPEMAYEQAVSELGMEGLGPSAAPQRGALARTSGAPAASHTSVVIAQARDAIKRGASRDAVSARLKQMGIDPSGL